MNHYLFPKVHILLLLVISSLVYYCRVNSFTTYAHHPKTARPEHANKPPKLKPKENREKHEEFLEHCRNGHTDTLIEMRYNYNIDLNYRSHKHHMETPLMAAVIHANYRVVEYLLHAGVDTSLHARHGRTPMHAAAELGFADILELLIEHGVGDVNERHDDGYRPLHRAILAGHTEGHGDVIKVLIENGADPHFVTNNGETPLIMAAERGKLHILKSLLHYPDKIDVDHVSKSHGYTALQTLAKHSRRTDEFREIIKLFAEAGANFDLPEPNKWAETPRDRLSRKGFQIPDVKKKSNLNTKEEKKDLSGQPEEL